MKNRKRKILDSAIKPKKENKKGSLKLSEKTIKNLSKVVPYSMDQQVDSLKKVCLEKIKILAVEISRNSKSLDSFNQYLSQGIIPPENIKEKKETKKISRKDNLFYFNLPSRIFKLTALFLIIGLNLPGLSVVGVTVANFNDVEKTTGNLIDSAILDFSLSSGGWAPPDPLYPGASTTQNITVVDEDESVDFKYIVSVVETGGNHGFCKKLDLEAFLGGNQIYSGDLLPFVSSQIDFGSSTDEWVFKVKLPPGAPNMDGKKCEFDFLYQSWQKEFLIFSNGFHDEEKVSNKIEAGEKKDNCSLREEDKSSIVINEFLPNPIGNDDKHMPDGEWVELYNLSDNPINVLDWILYDSKDSHPLIIKSSNSDNNGNLEDEGETIVPPHGFIVVYVNGKYKGWLDNKAEGDSLRLYSGTVGSAPLIDSYSYTGPAPENKSYARIPDGTGNFADPIPTPLAPNKIEEISIGIQKEIDETESKSSSSEENVISSVTYDTFISPESVSSASENSSQVAIYDIASSSSSSTVSSLGGQIEGSSQSSLEATAGQASLSSEENSSSSEISLTEEESSSQLSLETTAERASSSSAENSSLESSSSSASSKSSSSSEQFTASSTPVTNENGTSAESAESSSSSQSSQNEQSSSSSESLPQEQNTDEATVDNKAIIRENSDSSPQIVSGEPPITN